MLATGAVVAGAGTFEPAGRWGGDHHDGVPIFIYSRHEPVVPVLLGQGRRLFDDLDPQHINLERVRSLEGEHGVTHLRYRVHRSASPDEVAVQAISGLRPSAAR